MSHITVKRPVGELERTFKAASSIFPGRLVSLSSSGVAMASGTDDYIGTALYDDAFIAAGQTDEYVAGDMVQVQLKSVPMRAVIATGLSGADFDEGTFLKQTSSGKLTPESNNYGTQYTVGIALESGGTDDAILFVRL